MMKTLLYSCACLAAAGFVYAAAASSASAAPAYTPINPEASQSGTLLQQVQHGRCRAWYHECRTRWGFGWRFRRCMRWHGC